MFGKKEKNLERLRARQIESLISELAKSGVAVKTVSSSEYEVEIYLSDVNKRIPLMIMLPPDFPVASPPNIRVMGDIIHPIVNDVGEVVNYPPLRQWTDSSVLGMVVLGVLLQFRDRKPILKSMAGGLSQYPAVLPHPAPHPVPRPTPQPVLTDAVPPEFELLTYKSEDELKAMLDDPAQFNGWFGALSEVEAKTDAVIRQMERNAEIAGKTVSQEDDYRRLLADVLSLHGTYQQKKAVFDARHADQLASMEKASDRATLAQRLQQSIDEAEEVSEKTAEAFCEGSIPWTDFVRDFQKQRKLYHIRNAKKEMLVSQP